MTLDHLESGQHAKITAVDWGSLVADEAKRLRALGLDTGAEICVTHRGIFGTRDPLAVQVGSMTIAIRRVHAAAIEVAPQTEGPR